MCLGVNMSIGVQTYTAVANCYWGTTLVFWLIESSARLRGAIVTALQTHPVRSVCTASGRYVSRSWATLSPITARQSSIELSGLAGLNTGDVCRSKPVIEKAETRGRSNQAVHFIYRNYLHAAMTSSSLRFIGVTKVWIVCTFLVPSNVRRH